MIQTAFESTPIKLKQVEDLDEDIESLYQDNNTDINIKAENDKCRAIMDRYFLRKLKIAPPSTGKVE